MQQLDHGFFVPSTDRRFPCNPFPSTPSLPRKDFPETPSSLVKMSAPSLNKIAANSPSRQNPSELEQSISGALYDLETTAADLKVALRPLQFVSAKEVRT